MLSVEKYSTNAAIQLLAQGTIYFQKELHVCNYRQKFAMDPNFDTFFPLRKNCIEVLNALIWFKTVWLFYKKVL